MGRLVISRTDGQSVYINGPAEITYVKKNYRDAKLIIDAPKSTIILRGELIGAPPKNDKPRTIKRRKGGQAA